MPNVTIVLPNFNRTTQLRESLESLIEQSYQDFDVFLVDDGSTVDYRLFVPERLAHRVRIIELPGRSGAAKARNIGIINSKSPLVAFLDSDDIWHPEKLRLQVQDLERKCDVSFTNYTIETNGITTPRNLFPEFDVAITPDYLFRYGNTLGGFSGIICKREWLEKVDGLRNSLRSKQDYDLLIRLAKKGARIVGLHECLYIMRKESGDRISASSYNRAQGAISVINRYRGDFRRTKSPRLFRLIRQTNEYLIRKNHPRLARKMRKLAIAHFFRSPLRFENLKQMLALCLSR